MDLSKLVPAVRRQRGIYWSDGVMLVSGCSRVSEECEHCWSLRFENRFRINGGAEGVITVHAKRLERAVKCKTPQLYSIWNDFFHEQVNETQRRDFLYLMSGREGRRHYYIILTKRLEQFEQEAEGLFRNRTVPQNVLFGFTAGLQSRLEERYKVAERLRNRYGIRFICSVEPILGPIEFPAGFERVVSWVIVGVETGPGNRVDERSVEWIEGVVERCRRVGVPVFMKSLPGFYKGEVIRQFPVAEG